MFSLPATAARSTAAALALGSALALPAFRAPLLLARCADSAGDRIGRMLAVALEPIRGAICPSVLADSVDGGAIASASLEAFADSAKKALPASKYPQKKKSGMVRGIRISSAQVLKLAARGAMPGAVPVSAGFDHPAGLRLIGVSILGVGLQDGDLLTEAAGQRASSLATVVGVVLAARAHHSPEISGRFFRAGVFYSITVEQPYLPADVKG